MDPADYKDRRFLRWISQGRLAGWQFFFDRKNYKETKFFNVRKFGGIDGAYEEAIRYREEFLRTAGELGVLDGDEDAERFAPPLILKLSPRNSSGIVGVSRSIRQRDDRPRPEEYWVANVKSPEGIQKQKRFSIPKHGEKEALSLAIRTRREYEENVLSTFTEARHRKLIRRHIDELDTLLEWVSELEDSSDVFFFLGTINNPVLENTQKESMLNVRIGQRQFRTAVLKYWNHQCAITQASVFLTASHIKPWKSSNDSERLDVFNGLALSPVYDRAFDAGYITFNNHGTILISEKLRGNAKELGISGNERIRNLNFRHRKYLAYHREVVYE